MAPRDDEPWRVISPPTTSTATNTTTTTTTTTTTAAATSSPRSVIPGVQSSKALLEGTSKHLGAIAACPFSPSSSLDSSRHLRSSLCDTRRGRHRRRRRGGGISSSTTATASCSNVQQRQVTFEEQVQVRQFLPNWADPRVQAHQAELLQQQQQQQQQKDDLWDAVTKPQSQEPSAAGAAAASANASTADHAELRRLDHCYLRILRKHQHQHQQYSHSHSHSHSYPHHKKNHPTAAAFDWTSSSRFFSEDEWCPRGLEPHFDVHCADQRRRTKLQATLSVLLLQARREPFEEVARHYQTVSRTSHAQAHRQGLWDELEAQHGLGDVVLTALKDYQRTKTTHSNQLKWTLQELEYNVSSNTTSTTGTTGTTEDDCRRGKPPPQTNQVALPAQPSQPQPQRRMAKLVDDYRR